MEKPVSNTPLSVNDPGLLRVLIMNAFITTSL